MALKAKLYTLLETATLSFRHRHIIHSEELNTKG